MYFSFRNWPLFQCRNNRLQAILHQRLRWHASTLVGRSAPTGPILFNKEQCPGVDPPHNNLFPIINTLFSIPFSLLHDFPRLAGLITGSRYQLDLLCMAVEVVRLWAWDPEVPQNPTVSPHLLRRSRPPPIYDPSREGITFVNMRPSSTSAIATTSNASGSGCVFRADSGQYTPDVRLHDGAMTLFLPGYDVLRETDKICDPRTCATASLSGSAFCPSASAELVHSNVGTNSMNSNPDIIYIASSVAAWLEDVDIWIHYLLM